MFDNFSEEHFKTQKEIALLKEALKEWLDNSSIPEPNCSCHIAPPCDDCVEWGGLRELAERTKKLLQ